MSNVVTLSGDPLVTLRDILASVAERDDVDHIVIVVERSDGMNEVLYDRQTVTNVVMAAATLNVVAMDLTRGAIDDDA